MCLCTKCAFSTQADRRAADANKAVGNIEKTHKRAKDLDSEARNLLKKIQGKYDLTFLAFLPPGLL